MFKRVCFVSLTERAPSSLTAEQIGILEKLQRDTLKTIIGIWLFIIIRADALPVAIQARLKKYQDVISKCSESFPSFCEPHF